MFGFSVKVLQDGSRLLVVNPADTIMLLLFMVFTIWPLLLFVFQRPMPVRKVIVLGTITLLFYGYFIDTTRLTIDRSSQQATVERFHWFHWQARTFSTSALSHAYLATGRASDRIVLQYDDGHTQDFSVSNQMGGKPKAVLAINRFLGYAPE